MEFEYHPETYYHGTSKIFLDSIIEFGLGGINPNIKYKNLDLLRFLTFEAEKKLHENEKYKTLRSSVLAMSHQTFMEVLMPNGRKIITNYRHDGIYIGMTKERGLIYACDNKYGSEILEHCIVLYKMLKEIDKNFSLPKELNLFKIEKYIDTEHKPILIEIYNVKDSELETENGKNGSEYLKNLRNTLPQLSEKEKDIKIAYSNFKLLNPIYRDRMKFYEIEFEGKVGTESFEMTLTEIKKTSR